jgi:2'-5' RNA ligase
MNPTRSHRVFYALKPDAIARETLANAVDSLPEHEPEALRWVPADNWHVTLKFIGAVASSKIDDLRHCLHRAAGKSAPVNIRLNCIEPFPSSDKPVVLAATGAVCASGENLLHELDSCCSDMGWPQDARSWRCHLTLARVRRAFSGAKRAFSGERAFSGAKRALSGERAFSFTPVDIAVAFTASDVTLFESRTVNGHVSYLPVATAALAGSKD